MNTINELFFLLLRNALWLSKDVFPNELSNKTVVDILGRAKEQAVLGLVVDALIRNEIKLPQPCIYEAIAWLTQIQQKNQQNIRSLKELVSLMDTNSIDYVVVKGQAVAAYYQNPILRQPGDIDYYCDGSNFQKSKQAVEKTWGIELNSHGSEKHVHYYFQGVSFEGHFSLLSLYSKKKDRYWQKILNEDNGTIVNVDKIKVKTLSPTLHSLYVFLHLYHHLMELGVGLRQFCDLAVMLHNCNSFIDHTSLQCHLRALGMEKAYRACGSILIDKLGLPEPLFVYKLSEADRYYGKKILDVVLYRGNMGHYNKISGFRGWRHNIEATGIKVSHFVKFMPLAPAYSCRWLIHELRLKTTIKMKRLLK